MAFSLIGLYGIYLAFVGMKGNASQLKQLLSDDIKGFAPMAIAILILGALDNVESLRPMIKPFIGLAILTFVLKNYATVADQINQITGLNLPTG